MRKILVIAIVLLMSGCGVRVIHHRGFMGPDTWEATDGKVSVDYYNKYCCCVADTVLEVLADHANNGRLEWSKMADVEYRDKVLADTCWTVLNMPKEMW